MLGRFYSRMLLLGVFGICISGNAQSVPSQTAKKATTADIAITYTAERGKVASIDCGCFWMHGGSFNGAITFFHGLGVAANLTGGHASNIATGVDLDKVSFMMGPRYTFQPDPGKFRIFGPKQRIALFGEGLVGGVHAFNTVIPSSTGVKGAASSFAFQVGGGFDWGITKTIGIRAVEVNYIRSTLPNNGNDTQHDLRLSSGISFHFNY